MRKLVLLALLSCAAAPPLTPSFRPPWPGAETYHAMIVCAARHEYGNAIAEEFARTVEIVLAPGLVTRELTDHTQIRIRAELSQVEREAVLRHGATHWLEHRRRMTAFDDGWTYAPACSARSANPDLEFLRREEVLENAFNLCRREYTRSDK